MAILKVLEYPHKILKTKSQLVTVFDDELRATLNNMVETMYHDNGIGLAANQVGLLQRFFVMDISNEDESKNPLRIVNPIIIARSKEVEMEEGCLSLPNIYTKVKRAIEITVEYQDEYGKQHTLTTQGLMAHCIQHETDHLDGILSIDRISALKKALLVRKLEKSLRKEAS